MIKFLIFSSLLRWFHFYIGFLMCCGDELVWNLAFGVYFSGLWLLILVFSITHYADRETTFSLWWLWDMQVRWLFVCINPPICLSHPSLWHATNFGDEFWNRVGGRENFFHCNKCGMLSLSCHHCFSLYKSSLFLLKLSCAANCLFQIVNIQFVPSIAFLELGTTLSISVRCWRNISYN